MVLILQSFMRALGLCIALSVPTMGSITVLPGGEPKAYVGRGAIMSRDEYWRQNAENDFRNFTGDIIVSSHDRALFSLADGYRASADSFVRGAIQAWGEHLHLVIRPEEVWFTILTQMNFYMDANAEQLRDLFVSHQGQETIYIQDLTWERVIIRFQDEIQKRVKTPWLQGWIAPNFTTTTENDRMTANVLMMGLMKKYFNYEGAVTCGLPSVTLLGEQRDWEALLAKLDHLADFGAEPKAYGERLRPILKRFVTTFTDPDSLETVKFWNNIVTAEENHLCGGPPYRLSGWITGFHYWTVKGRPFARTAAPAGAVYTVTLDGVTYPAVDFRRLPVGYAKVPFIMRDLENKVRIPAFLMAGTLGKRVTAGPPTGYAGALNRTGRTDPVADKGSAGSSSATRETHNTLQPLSGWLLYAPVDHNATVSFNTEEEEVFDLWRSIKEHFNPGQCAAKKQ